MRHFRGVLLVAIVFIASLTLAQTVFDVSGTIQGNGVLVPASFSGTLALAGSFSTFSISDWNISLPPIQASQGALSALIFTPGNSTAHLTTQQQDTGLIWFFQFNSTQGPLLSLNIANFNPIGTNLGTSDFAFVQNGVQFVADQGSATLAPVPEPSSGILLATGLVGLAAIRRDLRRALFASRRG